jgi:hypothetical protein
MTTRCRQRSRQTPRRILDALRYGIRSCPESAMVVMTLPSGMYTAPWHLHRPRRRLFDTL